LSRNQASSNPRLFTCPARGVASGGEPHPFDLGRDAVQRYFKAFGECAQVARLKLLR
jgi:hypothetical protein